MIDEKNLAYLQEAFGELKLYDIRVETEHHSSPIYSMGHTNPVAHNSYMDTHLHVTLIGLKTSMKSFDRFQNARMYSVTDETPMPYYFQPDALLLSTR